MRCLVVAEGSQLQLRRIIELSELYNGGWLWILRSHSYLNRASIKTSGRHTQSQNYPSQRAILYDVGFMRLEKDPEALARPFSLMPTAMRVITSSTPARVYSNHDRHMTFLRRQFRVKINTIDNGRDSGNSKRAQIPVMSVAFIVRIPMPWMLKYSGRSSKTQPTLFAGTSTGEQDEGL